MDIIQMELKVKTNIGTRSDINPEYLIRIM